MSFCIGFSLRSPTVSLPEAWLNFIMLLEQFSGVQRRHICAAGGVQENYEKKDCRPVIEHKVVSRQNNDMLLLCNRRVKASHRTQCQHNLSEATWQPWRLTRQEVPSSRGVQKQASTRSAHSLGLVVLIRGARLLHRPSRDAPARCASLSPLCLP